MGWLHDPGMQIFRNFGAPTLEPKPLRARSKAGLGYAFVNLCDPSYVWDLR